MLSKSSARYTDNQRRYYVLVAWAHFPKRVLCLVVIKKKLQPFTYHSWLVTLISFILMLEQYNICKIQRKS